MGTRCLFDCDGEISDLPLDLVARKHVQPGEEDGAFENGVAGPV